MTAVSLGVASFVVGLSGAMSPGPFLTVTIARTMRQGPLAAAMMLAGHALLEAGVLVGLALGLHHWLVQPAAAAVLGVAGGAVLLWMAWGLGSGAISGAIAKDLQAAEHPQSTGGSAILGGVVAGVVVSLSNPYWALWWATIGVKLAGEGLATGPVGVAGFFVGHQLADFAWYGFVIAAIWGGRRLLTPGIYRIIMGVLAAALLYIGARFILQPCGVMLPWLPF